MNKVILLGRLTRDPELKTTSSGKRVARMGLAVDRPKRKNTTENQQTVDFINLVSWEKAADFCAHYLRKGTKILVEGRLQVRTYQAQDGTNRTMTEVFTEKIEFAESKKADGQWAAPAPVPENINDSGYGYDTDEDVPF